MDMRASIDLEALRASAFRKPEPKVQSLPAKDVARIAIKASKDQQEWLKTNVSSKDFVLAEIPLGSVAVVEYSNIEINASLVDKPIVVDINKKKIGRSVGTKFCPPVIVIEGAGRHNAARLRGKSTILAWVGAEAARVLRINADQFGSQELNDKISEQLRLKLVKKIPNGKGETMGPYPWIKEVYPFENYFVYQFDGDLYKQKYTCDVKKRSVKFDGDAEEVVQKYVDLEGAQTPMEKAIRLTPNSNQPEKHTGGFISNKTSPGSGVGTRVNAPPPPKSELGRKMR